MPTRHNLCTNPALTNNVTGWSGGSVPARTAVTGFDRPWAARYTAGAFATTAATDTGAVTAGDTYTVSVFIRPATFTANTAIYIEWINGSGTGFGYPNAAYSIPAGTIGRLSLTAVAPSGAVACRAIFDGINFSINTVDSTAVLIEPVASLGIYFDGDSPSGSWDGAPGNSASTLTDSTTVTVTGPSGELRLHAAAGILHTSTYAPQAGAPGVVRGRAPAGSVATVQQQYLPGTTAAVRLHPGGGQTLTTQQAPLTAPYSAARLHAAAGTITAISSAAAVLPGSSGTIRARAAAGVIAATQQSALTGAAALVRIRAVVGVVTTADAPDPGLPAFAVGPPQLRWHAGPPRIGRP